MKKFGELVTLEEDNEHCVILKVKPNCEMDLIKLGCFDGDETMFRLTKGSSVTCTVFRKDDKPYSWHWGLGGHTLVSDSMDKKAKFIQNHIEKNLGIKCLSY